MKEHFFQKDTFDLKDHSKYNLSIQAGLDGFSFVVWNEDEVILFRYEEFYVSNNNLLLRKIKETIGNERFISIPYKKTSVLFSGMNFTLIPRRFFSERLINTMFSEKYGTPGEKELVVKPLEKPETEFVFSVDKNLYHYFAETFPGCFMSHEAFHLIRLNMKSCSPLFHFHFHSSWFIALSNNHAIPDIINAFEYRTEEDLLFYMLAILNKKETQDVKMSMSGIGENDSRALKIKKYIPAAEIIQTVAAPQRETFRDFPFIMIPGSSDF